MLHLLMKRSRRAGIIGLVLAVVLLVLGALLATTARAQSAPAYHFVYLRSIDTLGTEIVTPGPSSIVGLLSMRGAPVMRWEQQHVNSVPGRLTLSIFAPGAPTTGLPTQNIVVNMVGDSAKLTISANGTTSEQALHSAAGAVALVGNSVLHTALMADHARIAMKASLPVFLTNGGRTIPATVTQQGAVDVVTETGKQAVQLERVHAETKALEQTMARVEALESRLDEAAIRHARERREDTDRHDPGRRGS